MTIVWLCLSIVLLLTKIDASWWSDLDYNEYESNVIYEDDVYNENEHKAELLSGKYVYSGVDKEEDIMGRDKKHKGNARCEEVKYGPFSLETTGLHVLPSHYHNISCKKTNKDFAIFQTDNKNTLIHFCKARHSECVTMEKEISVFKKPIGSRGCWVHDTVIVQAGCKCT